MSAASWFNLMYQIIIYCLCWGWSASALERVCRMLRVYIG